LTLGGKLSWQPITESEFRLLMAEQVLRLNNVLFPKWEAYGVMPERLPCARGDSAGDPSRETMFVVARSAENVLVYDDVEEEFGIGRMDPDGVVRHWSTFGEELAWALGVFVTNHEAPGSGAPPA
jgi:hypothetical protein